MGDRIAILAEGGRLAQYDTPDQILAEPANEFVARFVGNDRGLKRLSLATLEDLELEPMTNGASGPRAPVQTSLRDALSIMLTHRNEPLVATDEQGEPVGLATVDAVSAALSS